MRENEGMEGKCPTVFGELAGRHSSSRLARILGRQGVTVRAVAFRVRVEGDSNLFIQIYEGQAAVHGDSDSTETMTRDARMLSNALGKARLEHWIAVFDQQWNETARFDWP